MSKKLGIILSLLVGACASDESAVQKNPAAVFVQSKDVAFQEILPEIAEFGTVHGDRSAGAHGTFVRLKKGQGTPAHTHGAAYDGVVLAGLVENPIPGNGASVVPLGPGSYYHVPANAEHITRCAPNSASDCLTFFYQASAFDFDPSLSAADPAAGTTAPFRPAASVQFETILPGVAEFGTVYGDRATGRHGTFVKLTKGGATPPHLHTAAYHAVVLAGLLENPTPSGEAKPTTLPVGSYYFVPAGAEHVTRCADASPSDCLTFFYQEQAFDFVPVP
ncbi:MAG: DUF4437 domain-containing protein [Myxococcales bacterium]|nr:DUF4437 domain-containing protein [Myxococcales bacterium]